MINLKNSVNSKKIPENENLKKVVKIVYKILDFNKQQKHKGHHSELANSIQILTTKQMLQRLPMTPAQVKAGNASENLLHKICQTIYSLYQEKESRKRSY